MFEFLSKLFDTSGFPPRWHCGTWSPGHGWLHIVADCTIGLAYFAIPCGLAWLVMRRKNIPFTIVFWLFCAFILSCGFGHFVEASLFWKPWYRFAGLVKVVTAVASWVTVVALMWYAPRALRLPGLEQVNAQLEAEIEQRQRIEEELVHAKERLEKRNEELEDALEQLERHRQRAETKAEEATESQDRFDLAIRGTSDGLWEWNLETDEVWYADRFQELVGYRPGKDPFAATLDTFKELLHADDHEHVWASVDAHLERDVPYDVEYRLRTRAGQWRWFRARAACQRNGEGRAIRMAGSIQDIHARKLAERALKEVVGGLALPHRGLALEHRTFDSTHFSLSDAIECGLRIRGLSSAASSEEDFAQQLTRWLHESFVDEEGSSGAALVRVFRTKAFGQLDDEQQAFALTLAEGLDEEAVCLTLTGSSGDESEWNDPRSSSGHRAVPLPSEASVRRFPMITRLLEQLRLDIDDVVSPTPGKKTRSEDYGASHAFHIAHALGSEFVPDQGFVETYGIESVVGFGDRLPDGSAFFVVVFSKVALDDDQARLLAHLGHSTRMGLMPFLPLADLTREQILAVDQLLANHERVAVEQDRTLQVALAERTRANRELERSNQELDSFAYIASHDLKTPLRNIESLSGWIRQEAWERLGEKPRDYLSLLTESVERMRLLLDDLLQYSRVGRKESKPEEVDLGRVVSGVVTLIGVPEQFSVEVAPGSVPVYAPKTAVHKVLQNLIDNAVKYRERDDGRISICSRRVDGGVEMVVYDDGPGILPKFHEKAFQVFQRLHSRTDIEGTGIGLALVKKTVETYNGRVTLESDGIQGTRFRIFWPSACPSCPSSDSRAPTNPPSPGVDP